MFHARRALASMTGGETLVVLATDPEAPIDLAALAADGGHGILHEHCAGEWRITLTKAIT